MGQMISMIISGGELDDSFAEAYLGRLRAACKDVLIIASDSGLAWCIRRDIVPDVIAGDFDSLPGRLTGRAVKSAAWDEITQRLSSSVRAAGGNGEAADAGMTEEILRYYMEKGCEIRRFRPEKDLTDTQIAAEIAMEKGCRLIHVLGGTGGRTDHMLGNLQVMELCLEQGAVMVMADRHNRITLHDSSFSINRDEVYGHGDERKYISFVPWGGAVRSLTLRGFKYPLEHHDLATDRTLGISNELTAAQGEIIFTGGRLLMIEAAD